MLASGLHGRFWARAVFYAADISNIQYRTDLQKSPHEALFGAKPDVSKCQPFGVECWLYVRADQRQDRTFDARGESAIYCGRVTMDNKSSFVCYVPSRQKFVVSNNVVFGQKCPMRKDYPNVIVPESPDVDVLPPEANTSELTSSQIEGIIDQTQTHYVLRMRDGSTKSVEKQKFVLSLIHSQEDKLSQEFLALIHHHVLLEEMSPFVNYPINVGDTSVHFTDKKKFVDPKNYADAMSRDDNKEWKTAFEKEMQGLINRKIFTVVDCPPDRKPLGTTMVWKYKVDDVHGTVTHKCRLCLQGDWQKEGVDFFKNKTYSAVLNCRENRVLCALAAANGWHMFASDITQAFTYGEPDVPLYCYPPEGFSCPPGKVLHLNACLYGAKQAPACFKKVLTEFLLADGFSPVNDAQTVFVKHVGKSILVCACFVDDVLHCTNDLNLYRTFRKKFETRFDLKSDDSVDLYLGNRIIVDNSKHTVSVSQKHYILSCLDKFGLNTCNEVDTPMANRLSTSDQPTDANPAAQELYRAMVGSLLYIASWTRVDIAFAVSELSRFVSNPGKVHIEAAKRVFRYLKRTMNMALEYSRPRLLSQQSQFDKEANCLWGYVDADWAGCPDTRKSTSGYAFMLNGATISWRSKRQSVVALSTAEAEFISASAMVQEVIFLRKFLANLGFAQDGPTPVFADNQTSVAWSEGSVGGSERAKHIDLRKHFVHDAVQAGHVVLKPVESKLNAADLLTKPSIAVDLYSDFRRRLMGY
jgi:hypothetical protein